MAFTKFVFGLMLAASMVGCEKQVATAGVPKNISGTKKALASPQQANAEAASPTQAPVTISSEPHNVSPLGLELGVANLAGVKAMLSERTRYEERGLNKFTGGRMLWSNGDGLEVDGLTEALFIFDKDDLLSGVVMTVPKDPTAMYQKLSSKYSPVSNKIDDFMHYGYARLKKGDSIVEIDSPHLSFTMEIRYLTNRFSANFARMSAEEKAQKKREQTDAL